MENHEKVIKKFTKRILRKLRKGYKKHFIAYEIYIFNTRLHMMRNAVKPVNKDHG